VILTLSVLKIHVRKVEVNFSVIRKEAPKALPSSAVLQSRGPSDRHERPPHGSRSRTILRIIFVSNIHMEMSQEILHRLLCPKLADTEYPHKRDRKSRLNPRIDRCDVSPAFDPLFHAHFSSIDFHFVSWGDLKPVFLPSPEVFLSLHV